MNTLWSISSRTLDLFLFALKCLERPQFERCFHGNFHVALWVIAIFEHPCLCCLSQCNKCDIFWRDLQICSDFEKATCALFHKAWTTPTQILIRVNRASINHWILDRQFPATSLSKIQYKNKTTKLCIGPHIFWLSGEEDAGYKSHVAQENGQYVFQFLEPLILIQSACVIFATSTKIKSPEGPKVQDKRTTRGVAEGHRNTCTSMPSDEHHRYA